MKKIRKEVKIGIFGILMIGLLYWGLNFLKGKDLFTGTHLYYAKYEQVGDMRVSAPVTFRGVKIGVVTDMNIRDMSDIIVQLSVKSKYKIPNDSKARIVSTSLMGGKAVEIELGTSDIMLANGDTLRSEMDKGLLDMAGSEIELIKKKATQVVDEIVKTLSSINALLNEENLKNVNSILSNVSSMSANINTLVASETKSISALIHDLNTFTQMLGESAPRLSNTIGNFESISDSFRQADIHLVVVQANQLLAQLNETACALNQSEGTAGKLINDPVLYNNLMEATRNLSVLLEDVKARPGRYVRFSIFGGRNR